MGWAGKIDQVASGYRDAALLIYGVKTGIFEALGDGPATPAEVAAARGLEGRATDVVMCALCAAGFLEHDAGRFRLPDGARPYLLADGERTMTSIVGHNRGLIRGWAHLDDILRGGRPPKVERTEDDMRDFILGMDDISRMSSAEVAETVDVSDCRRLLDLGGGPGTAALAFARRNPDLECVVYDLPGPLEIAREKIATAALADRVTVDAGDFMTDPLGEGFDVVYISNILHMFGPEGCIGLLRRAAGALTSDGRLLIKDFFLAESRVEPAFSAQFSVNMLVATGEGRTYTLGEMEEMLNAVGFTATRTWTVAVHSTVIEAKRES